MVQTSYPDAYGFLIAPAKLEMHVHIFFGKCTNANVSLNVVRCQRLNWYSFQFSPFTCSVNRCIWHRQRVPFILPVRAFCGMWQLSFVAL